MMKGWESIDSVLKGTAIAIMFMAATMLQNSHAAAQSSDDVTVVVMTTPSAKGADARKEYSQKVNPLGEKAGVQLVKYVKIGGKLVGELDYKAVVILGFVSMQAARDFFSSDEYKALIPLRDKAFDRYDVLIGQ